MWKWCAGILALGLSGSALGQELAPPTDQQEIVVQGNRSHDQALRQFIRSITVSEPNFGQLGRFESPACPYVLGLGETQDRMVATRIRQVADAIGVETGEARCRPNLFVFVVDDKKAAVRWMARHATNLMTHGDGRRIVIPLDKSPAAGWHVLGMKDDVGRESGFYIVGSMASRLRPMARPHFLASVLVVEARALKGLTTTELGDYAAMRAFAQLDPTKLTPPTAPTILTILDAPMDAAIPLTLTDWDLAFLNGLYASSLNQYAVTQQREIQRAMRKELAEHGEP